MVHLILKIYLFIKLDCFKFVCVNIIINKNDKINYKDSKVQCARAETRQIRSRSAAKTKGTQLQ